MLGPGQSAGTVSGVCAWTLDPSRAECVAAHATMDFEPFPRPNSAVAYLVCYILHSSDGFYPASSFDSEPSWDCLVAAVYMLRPFVVK